MPVQTEISSPTNILQLAKDGDNNELGKLLDRYSNYLRFLAKTQLDRRLKRRIGASDVVQETMLEAHRDFGQFRGESIKELVSWLRKILIHNLIRESERHLIAEKRDIRLEVPMQSIAKKRENANPHDVGYLADKANTPSVQICRAERLNELSQAISNLNWEQKRVVMMRHVEGLRFSEIALSLGKSEGACRMLWLRAMDQLRNEVHSHD